jgi:hypothetical protein
MLLFTIFGMPGNYVLSMALILTTLALIGRAKSKERSNTYWRKSDPRRGDYNSMISQGRGHSLASRRYARLDVGRRV